METGIEDIKHILSKNSEVFPKFYEKIIFDSFEEYKPTSFELETIKKILNEELEKVKSY